MVLTTSYLLGGRFLRKHTGKHSFVFCIFRDTRVKCSSHLTNVIRNYNVNPLLHSSLHWEQIISTYLTNVCSVFLETRSFLLIELNSLPGATAAAAYSRAFLAAPHYFNYVCLSTQTNNDIGPNFLVPSGNARVYRTTSGPLPI